MASRVPVMGVPSLPTFRQARKSNAVTARCHGGGGGGSGGLRRTGGGGSGDGNGNGRGRVQRFAVNSAVALLASAVLAAPADAAPAKGKVPKGKVALPDLTHFDFAKQASSTMALSAAVGYGSAMLAKTLATGAFVVLAGTFAFIKWLEIQGLITINWKNVETFVQKQMKFLDVNGDGTVDAKDVAFAVQRFEGFMATSVPSAGGFAAGFAAGMR